MLRAAISFIQTSKKRLYFSIGGCIALLLILSAIIFPLMFFTAIHSKILMDKKSPGTLTFTSSNRFDPQMRSGYNDIVTLRLYHLLSPPAGMKYYAWLLPDQGDDTTIPLLLGTLYAGESANLTYNAPNHTNLLASYSGIRITVQPERPLPNTPSQDPTTWRWDGAIPNIPTPGDGKHYSLLSHLRHLLAQDPTLQANHIPGGLALWLTQNASKVEEWASAAQGTWHGEQTSDGEARLIQRHMIRILDYLNGQFYAWRDVPAGAPWLVDPVAGKIGLLESVPHQEPPAYMEHVDTHLTGLTDSPGHTVQQEQLAILVDHVLTRMKADLQQVRKDAATIVKMTPKQLRQQENQDTLSDMMNLATEVKSGWFDPSTGSYTGGVLWITSRLQQLALVPLHVNTHGARP